MVPALKDIYRKVEQKIYLLGKLCYLVDKISAVLIYKQTVLPYLDYVGFVLLSCNVGLRKSLQVLQNNALRLCLHYRLIDHVRVEQLHSEAKLQGIEQRCIFQLLKLLFNYSKDPFHLKIPMRRTRAGSKISLVFLQDVRIPIYKVLYKKVLRFGICRQKTLKSWII